MRCIPILWLFQMFYFWRFSLGEEHFVLEKWYLPNIGLFVFEITGLPTTLLHKIMDYSFDLSFQSETLCQNDKAIDQKYNSRCFKSLFQLLEGDLRSLSYVESLANAD